MENEIASTIHRDCLDGGFIRGPYTQVNLFKHTASVGAVFSDDNDHTYRGEIKNALDSNYPKCENETIDKGLFKKMYF